MTRRCLGLVVCAIVCGCPGDDGGGTGASGTTGTGTSGSSSSSSATSPSTTDAEGTSTTSDGSGSWDCAAGTWVPAGSLAAIHFENLTAALPGNRALVASGHSVFDPAVLDDVGIPESEVWDPATETWHLAGPLDPPAASTLYGTSLADGSVLVAGYFATAGEGDLVKRFDPATEVWVESTPIPNARRGATVALADGRVLVAAGASWEPGDWDQTAWAESEIFDPTTETWTAVAPMSEPRAFGTAVRLPNGEVLVTGGVDAALNAMVTAERFDPVTETWRPTGSMNEHHATTLVPLPDGRVLVFGGSAFIESGGSTTAETYDPDTEIWTPVGSLSTIRHFSAVSPLPDGSVLVVGGVDEDDYAAHVSAERFDPTTGEWALVEPPAWGRAHPAAALLDDGSVMVAGGLMESNDQLGITAVFEAERFVCPAD